MKKFSKYLKLITPAIIGGLFILLASFNINGPVWFDEGYSTVLNRFEPKEMIELTAKDVHPPLYYLALKAWSLLFGESDIALRMMSVMFGALTILTGYILIKRLTNQKIATIATAIMALSPSLLRYSQEMRMYTLASFMVMLATLIFMIAIAETDKTIKPTEKVARLWKKSYPRKIWMLWTGYGIMVALGMWTHYFTACVWFAQLLYLIYHYKKAVLNPQLVFSYLVAGIIFFPWLPVMMKQTGAVQGGFWIPPISGQTLPDYAAETMMGVSASEAKNWLAITLLLIILITIFLTVKYLKTTEKKFRPQFEIILVTTIVPVLFLMSVSLPPLKPMFVNRYLIHSSIMLWLLIGMASGYFATKMTAEKSRFKGLLIGAGAIITPLVFDIVFVNMRKPASYVKPAVEIAKEQTRGSAEKIYPIITADELTFYQAMTYETAKHPVLTVKDWRKHILPHDPLDRLKNNVIESTNKITEKYDRFWLIQNREDKAEKEIDELTKSHRQTTVINTGHYILTEFRKK